MARAASRATARSTVRISATGQRLAYASGKEIVQEEVDLEERARPSSGGGIGGNDGFEAELQVSARPENSRIDSSDGRSTAAIERFLQRDLDEGDQAIERLAQSHVLHERLQIGDAVLNCEARLEHMGMALYADVAILGHRRSA